MYSILPDFLPTLCARSTDRRNHRDPLIGEIIGNRDAGLIQNGKLAVKEGIVGGVYDGELPDVLDIVIIQYKGEFSCDPAFVGTQEDTITVNQ